MFPRQGHDHQGHDDDRTHAEITPTHQENHRKTPEELMFDLDDQVLDRGKAKLDQLQKEISKRHPSRAHLQELSSEYYTIIPHDFGRKKAIVIDTAEELKEEYDCLEACRKK